MAVELMLAIMTSAHRSRTASAEPQKTEPVTRAAAILAAASSRSQAATLPAPSSFAATRESRPRSHIEYTIAQLDDLFQGFKTQLRAGMPASTARHAGKNLKSHAAGRNGIFIPWRNEEEPTSDLDGMKRIKRLALPIRLGLAAKDRRARGETAENFRFLRILEKGAHSARLFGNTGCSRLAKLGA